MNTGTPDLIFREVCEHIDWTRPELADVRALYDSGAAEEAAIAFVRYLRGRKTPHLGYTQAYIETLRSHMTDKQRKQARQRLEEAIDGELVSGVHSNPITQAGAETLFTGADAAVCEKIGETVLAWRDKWDQGAWGTTRGICELLARLLVLPECSEKAILPVFGWLLKQLPAEWAWARTWRETMLGNSGHNWWLHTYLGFFKAGLFFPELSDYAKFRAFAPEYFEHEMRLLMEPDGFTKERSGYHWGTARHFYDLMHIVEANGIRMSETFYAHLRQVADVEWKTLAPNGDVPRVGDTGHAHHGNSLEKIRTVAARFSVPEAKYVAESLNPDWQPATPGVLTGWGENLWPAYEALTSKAPSLPTADTDLPDSGYYIMREDWTSKADWLCVEAGTTGTIVTSHNHTHFFNFELYSRGRAILIDNCSGPYGKEPSRTWRVGSSSHNVVTIDGADHIPMRNEWRWNATVTSFTNAWITDTRYAYFSGVHEGYDHLPERVPSSRRKIFYLRGGYWIILDRFTVETEAEHEYQLHFHVGVPCTLADDGRLVTSGEGGNLLIVPVDGARGEGRIEPNPYPLENYDNPDHLCYTHRAAGDQLFATLLIPFDNADVPEAQVNLLKVEADGRTLSPWEATALEIVINGNRDIYVDQHMQWNLPWIVGGYEGHGRVFHSRCR